MGKQLNFLFGMGVGAAVVYLRERVPRGMVSRALRGGANRVQDAIARRMRSTRPDDTADRMLEARVRSLLEQVIQHPSAIAVRSNDGYVQLQGPVLQGEVERVLGEVLALPGVMGVDNFLDVESDPSRLTPIPAVR
jgi:osmotically-inducible protein OsmY